MRDFRSKPIQGVGLGWYVLASSGNAVINLSSEF
jgi:hypothetical protein